ncbi:MAG: membrane protein insertase YidC [Deltaproteobacteria bacterium]|nr:membrane protein insertase YidC [Deltaproteobacteria bacterium]
MDKNTIIALVLILFVWIFWSLISAPKPQKSPTPVREGKGESTERPRAPERDIKGQGGRPGPPPRTEKVYLPVSKGVEQEITVETPLYRAVFTTRGATLMSLKLKRYHVEADPNSPLVEMIEVDRGVLGLEIPGGPSGANSGIIYSVDKRRLSVTQESGPGELRFKAISREGISIEQVYRFYPNKYPIGWEVTLSNSAQSRVEGNLGVILRNRPPTKKKGYYSFVGISFLLDEELQKLAPKKLKETRAFSGMINWLAIENDYFMSAVILEDQDEATLQARYLSEGILEAAYRTPLRFPQGKSNTARFTLYLGPRDISYLKPLGKKLDMAINFGWTDIIAKPLLYVLRLFYKYTENYGVAIILLTVLIKILFWPLTHKSYKSMKEMQKLQPLMAKIREKYKNNREQMNRELMALYKTYKINPMGGCLPMIIQIPVFFALFRILGSSIELRHAPFMLWINDLSAPDRLFRFPFQIPFMSPPYGIPVLTLLMGASMFIQQKMTPTPGDPTQAKVMMFLPIIFTLFFINFPSGLVLYWLVNNLISIGQQYRIKKSSA